MSADRLELRLNLDKHRLILIGTTVIFLTILIYVFTIGGYTVTSKEYLNGLRDESAKNYERSVISYTIGLLEGYSEAMYAVVISSYNIWIETNNTDMALILLDLEDVKVIEESMRRTVNSLESYVELSKYYKDLTEALLERSSAILSAYDRYLEYLGEGDINGAKEAIKDMRYNIDMLRIAAGNIASRA